MRLDELTAVYISRFINDTKAWGRQWLDYRQTPPKANYAKQCPDMDTKAGRYRFEPVTTSLVLRHFTGDVTCAWAALDGNCKSKWLCFDSDTADGALDRLEHFLHQHGWHVIREGRRAGRDGHAWLLFDDYVPASSLIALGDAMTRLSGVTGLERFPKCATGYSQVRGPLGVNQKPEAKGTRGLFDGAVPTLKAQLEWLAVQPLNRAEDAVREAKRHMPSSPVKREQYRAPRQYQTGPLTFQILDFVKARRAGNEWVAQCPLCDSEGHDRHQDNLRIWKGGSAFCCVFNGPSQAHKNRDIMAALIARYAHVS